MACAGRLTRTRQHQGPPPTPISFDTDVKIPRPATPHSHKFMASSASPAKSSKLVTRLMSSSLSTPDRALETRTLLSWRQRQARAYRCWFPCEQGGLRTSIGAEASESDIVTAFLLLARGTRTLDWCAQTRGGGGRIKRPLPQYYLLTSLPKGKMAKKLRTICFKPSQRKKKKKYLLSLSFSSNLPLANLHSSSSNITPASPPSINNP